jgi:hypothetical protein
LYGYYATYALPAFIACVILLIKNYFGYLYKFSYQRYGYALALLYFISFALCSYNIYSTDINTPLNQDNVLIKKGVEANLVFNTLKREVPVISNDSVFIMDGVDLNSFGSTNGLRFFYNNEAVAVYEYRNLAYENGQPFVYVSHDPTNGTLQKKALNPHKLFLFKLMNGDLVSVSPPDAS